MKNHPITLISLSTIASLSVAQFAQAQSQISQGLSVALSVNSANASLNLTASNGGGTATGAITTNTYATGIQLQYGQAITHRTAVMLGMSNVMQGYGVGVLKFTGEPITIKNTRSLYVAPGFFITDSTFVYAKAAAVTAATTLAGGNPLTGTSYGLGATYFAGSNLFFQTELLAHTFNDLNHTYLGAQFTEQYKVNSLSGAIGYQF